MQETLRGKTMPRKKRKKTQATLPQIKGEVWEVGRRPLDVQVAELATQGEEPELVMVLQASEPGGAVFGTALPSSAPPAALVDVLQQAMREPMVGKPRRPEVVRVGSQAEAEALRPTLAAAGIRLEVAAELEMLDAFHAQATQLLGGMSSDYRTQAARAGETLDEAGLRELFATARQFYQAALWEVFDDAEIFTIELQPTQGPPKTLYGIIMGNMGQEFGLALYASMDDFQRFYELGVSHLEQFPEMLEDEEPSDDDWQETAEMAAHFLSVPAIALTFTSERDIPPPLAQEVRQLQLPLANRSAYPLMMRTGDGGMQVANAADLRDILAALRAILAWDNEINVMDVDDEIDITITSEFPAVANFLPALTARTTLIENPFTPEDESDDDLADVDFSALVRMMQPEPAAPKKKAAAKATKTGKKAPAAPTARVYTLKVYLQDGPISEAYAGREISRQIDILGHQTLHDLHQAIFQAFERWEEHLYEFNLGEGPQDRSQVYFYQGGWDADDDDTGDPEATTIDDLDLSVGRYFGYIFDMGDSWEHVVEVTAIKEGAGKGQYPRVSKKVGAAPPQYPDDDEDVDEDD
jgi:hypothetical protein